ncbi:MAG: acyloxyacyl hydrolase [Saprospiraceae bacterium]|nr:acyloxyacyl hydrolase [Saprospiraceae bacterium]
MKNAFGLFLATLLVLNQAKAQYWEGDNWYNNPLGFEPLKLHTSMAFLVPAVAVGACLLLTERDTTLKNKLSGYGEAGFSWGYKYPYTFLPQLNFGINYQLRKFMSVGVEFDIYSALDDYNHTAGLGIRPFARFYPVNRDNWRLYFESGGGLIYFFDYFPKPTEQDNRLGTHWNGTTKYGLGAEVNLSSNTNLMFGVRHIHVSNSNTKGVERNPSHDSNGFFIGLSHVF